MASKFLRNLQIGFSISFFLLLLSSLSSYLSIRDFIKDQQMVEHTLEVLNNLDHVNLNLKDRVIGYRGILLSKNKEFADPYYDSKKSSDSLLLNLRYLVSDNPNQIKNAEELLKSFKIYDDRLKITVSKIQGGGEVSTEQMNSSRNQMEKIQDMLYRMKLIERELLKERTQSTTDSSASTMILLIITSILSLVITIFFYFRIRNDFKDREALKNQLLKKEVDTTKSILKIEEIADNISKGNYSTRIESQEDLGVLSKLSNSLNAMAISLEESFDKLNDNEWLQTGIANINELLVGNKTINEISEESLNYLITYGKCENGALYLFEDGRLLLKSANTKEEYMKPFFETGEGYVGQTFKSGKIKMIDQIEDSNFSVTFSAGKLNLKSLLFIPIVNEKTTIGVIELGCANGFGKIDLEFYEDCSSTIGSALLSAKSRRHIQNLLEETQTQTEELQAQHNELENLNAELEAQSQKLQASEEELKVQQEELLQSNQELEERSKLLEEKNMLISDRNKEIQIKAEELELSTKYKSEFLANMSHELRTPLNSILLLSRLSAENPEGNLTEEQVESAKVIQSSGNGLLSLIDEILDLSKIEAGKMDISYEVTPIKDLQIELEGMFKPIAQQKGIDLDFKTEDNVDVIEIDESRLGQILKNLLSNAIKFTSKGSVSLLISEENEKVIFKVKDTGIGIAKDKQKLIFEAFQQEDGSTRRKFGGTGLGLSISRELVKLLGGEISIDSEPGKGSTFMVSFPKYLTDKLDEQSNNKIDDQESVPLFKEPIEDITSFISPTIPEDVEDDRSNIKKDDQVILIVEDDTLFAKTLLNYARKEKYKGIVVVRGDLALPAALQYKPRAILLDIQLPIMDGWMIMEQLKTNSKTKHIPVHMMSSMQAKKESLLKGAVDFINKPFAIENMSGVFQKIEAALARNPKKVLIVEENTKHATALSYFLSNFNINTEIKNNVEDSTKSLLEGNVDCVILDMGVPYETAYDTLEVIRKSEGLENLPIIIFTGKNISKIEELKLKKYADSIVVKTAHSYQRILDEVGLFLHLVDDDENEKPKSTFKKLGMLAEVIKDKTVLIADDDVRNIFSLSKALEKHQMKVISAIDGKEAMQKLSENQNIDVVLMDIMMPEMDGYETITAIRKNPKYRKLPIIAVTAKAMMGDREKCIQVGASDYISKPVDIDQLLSLLRVWLYQG